MRQEEEGENRREAGGHEQRICESCGRLSATEVLHRRPRRMAEIEKRASGPPVLLCHECWLDILCGLKLIPPERAVVRGGDPELEARYQTRAAFRHLTEAYAGVQDAQPGGQDYKNAREAFLGASRSMREQAAIVRRAAHTHRAQGSHPAPTAYVHSGEFLNLKAAAKVLRTARAQGSLARQEQADFREALAALLNHASNVCKRADQLAGSG